MTTEDQATWKIDQRVLDELSRLANLLGGIFTPTEDDYGALEKRLQQLRDTSDRLERACTTLEAGLGRGGAVTEAATARLRELDEEVRTIDESVVKPGLQQIRTRLADAERTPDGMLKTLEPVHQRATSARATATTCHDQAKRAIEGVTSRLANGRARTDTVEQALQAIK